MRFIDRITFVNESPGGYNPGTGGYDETTLTEQTVPCNVSPLGTTRTAELFGSVDVLVEVVRLQRPHNEPFDYCLVNNKRMVVKRHIPHRRESVFYLEGVSL